jgi:alkyl hydroperoxide reductase subunit AhpF
MQNCLLNDEVCDQVREILSQMKAPVTLLFFGSQNAPCEYCDETRQIAEELADLSDMLSLAAYDLEQDAQVAQQYNVDKAPTLVLAGVDGEQLVDFGIRFAGIPMGHEFSSLVHDLVLVSSRDSGLTPATRLFLGKLKEPLHLQVFATPT